MATGIGGGGTGRAPGMTSARASRRTGAARKLITEMLVRAARLEIGIYTSAELEEKTRERDIRTAEREELGGGTVMKAALGSGACKNFVVT